MFRLKTVEDEINEDDFGTEKDGSVRLSRNLGASKPPGTMNFNDTLLGIGSSDSLKKNENDGMVNIAEKPEAEKGTVRFDSTTEDAEIRNKKILRKTGTTHVDDPDSRLSS
jgi:hypothetical protein